MKNSASSREEPTVEPVPPDAPKPDQPAASGPAPREIGGPKGLEPTRYGDWERRGRCIDF